MINYRIIARVFSILLIVEGLMMLFSALVSFLLKETVIAPFIYSALITLITGIIVFTPFRNEEKIYGNREGYIIVTGIWLLFALFGTLPYLFSGTIKTFTDALFESVSGFTTTGATILNDIESVPKGMLFWRSLTQWLGGMGIIFLSLYVLPVFKDINIQLSTTEFSGQASDKIHPRTKDAGKRLIGIYIGITLAEVLLLAIGGMPVFDAVCHSFGTVSTGGFSTHSNQLAVFSTPFIKVVITIFMFIAGTNMTILYFGLKREFRRIIFNNEFAYYAAICVIFSIIVSVVLWQNNLYSAGGSFLNGTFQVISVITTTGYYSGDYNLWGNFLILIMFVLMFTGGTVGSTSGGVKITRLMIMAKNNRLELRRLLHPDAFIPVRLNRKSVPQNIVYNVLVFVTLYFLVVCVSALVISFMGYDLISSFSTAAAMLANIGPGIGTFGPFTNYSVLPDAGKLFLAVLMLLGRLEMMSVMILFSRSFYRK
jgi:trk system potassium uptake protein